VNHFSPDDFWTDSPSLTICPRLVALMTATELFYEAVPRPRFVALETLREKRTGYAADERSSVDLLQQEFPHVDFSDLSVHGEDIPKGEDNDAVRARACAFLEGPLTNMEEEAVALVTHKGWLRELRGTLKGFFDEGLLRVDFDVHKWDQTLYKNAEIRVATCGWEGDQLTSIVSRSVDNALGSVVHEACKPIIEKIAKQTSRDS